MNKQLSGSIGILSNFNLGSLEISKTGKQLKEKISAHISIIEGHCSTLSGACKNIVDLVGIEPTRVDTYRSSDYPMDIFLNAYKWDQYRDGSGDMKSDSTEGTNVKYNERQSGPTPEAKNKYMLCERYNEIRSKYNSFQIQLYQLNSAMSVLEDSKAYKINLSQASKLGF